MWAGNFGYRKRATTSIVTGVEGPYRVRAFDVWTRCSEATMQETAIRIDLNTNDQNEVDQGSDTRDVQELEQRHLPLVVIAIIAVLIGLLLPA